MGNGFERPRYTPGMSNVRETRLPGVGVRHEFATDDGGAMAVIVHYDGRREIVSYDDKNDPDACHSLVSLSEHDTQTLAEILGVSHVTETVDTVRHSIEHMALEWVQVKAGSPVAGASIGTGEFRTRTGASIVAILRGDVPVPAPDADFVLEAGDMVVAVGAPDGLTSLRSLLGH